MAVLNLVWGLGAPFAGALSDKVGAVRVALGGTLLYVLGLTLMATAAGGNQLLFAGALIGLGIAWHGLHRCLRHGRAGGAAGKAGLGARACHHGQRHRPVRGTAIRARHPQCDGLGYFAFHHGRHRRFDGAAGAPARAGSNRNRAVRLGQRAGAWRRAERGAPVSELPPAHRRLFRLRLSHRGRGGASAAFLADKGFGAGLGAIALTVVGGANILGTYACGRIGDIVPKRLALAFIYLARAAIFVALIYLPLTESSVLAFSFLLGLLWLGTVPLTSGLVVTFFGPRWLSMLYGIVFLSHQIGSFTGAWLGGWLYDTYHSYDLLWWTSVAIAVLAAALHLPIKERAASRLAETPAPAA